MSTGSPHLVLLTRVPVPGRVKTRLMGVLPGEQCAQLQRAFALDAVERAREALASGFTPDAISH